MRHARLTARLIDFREEILDLAVVGFEDPGRVHAGTPSIGGGVVRTRSCLKQPYGRRGLDGSEVGLVSAKAAGETRRARRRDRGPGVDALEVSEDVHRQRVALGLRFAEAPVADAEHADRTTCLRPLRVAADGISSGWRRSPGTALAIASAVGRSLDSDSTVPRERRDDDSAVIRVVTKCGSPPGLRAVRTRRQPLREPVHPPARPGASRSPSLARPAGPSARRQGGTAV